MNYWPYIVVIVLFGLLLSVNVRNRRRAAAGDADRARRIGVGTEVMTTSGLYGTVVRRSDDDTVLLTIAPGVEVKWALAALRDVSELPARYAHGMPRRGGDVPVDEVPENRDSGAADRPRRESGS